MKPVFAYIGSLFRDPIFPRACLFLWGLPFVALGIGFALLWQQQGPEGWAEWLAMCCLLLVGAMGLCLMYVSVASSDSTFDRVANFASEGGDIIGLVLVAVVVLVALPATAIIRALFPQALRP
jgi:hypothetical protein